MPLQTSSHVSDLPDKTYRLGAAACRQQPRHSTPCGDLERLGGDLRTPPSAPATATDAYAARVGDAVETELRLLLEQQAGTRLADRERRYRHIGNLDGGDLP
jgi:hypothetical protein